MGQPKCRPLYVDATEAPWAPHFRMSSYITQELQELVIAEFSIDAKAESER